MKPYGMSICLFLVMVLLVSGCTDNSPERILFDSETDQELDTLKWQCKTMFARSGEHVTHGFYSLKMELYPSDYPGLSIQLVNNSGDWRGFAALKFDIFNPSKTELPLNVRIDDHKDVNEYGDRFNGRIMLHSGINKVNIPLSSLVRSESNKPLNLKTITNFILFIDATVERKELYVDYIRLDP